MTRPSTARRIAPDSGRLGRAIPPIVLEFLSAARRPWHEEPEAVRAGLCWGRKKERLLEWVRAQMLLRLTVTEQHAIELYYLRGLSYRDTAMLLDVNPSSVYRSVERGIRKLRAAAKANPPEDSVRRRRRRQ